MVFLVVRNIFDIQVGVWVRGRGIFHKGTCMEMEHRWTFSASSTKLTHEKDAEILSSV